MYERILVPLDGSQLAEAAVDHAEELARRLGATLILFHAITPLDQVIRDVLPWGTLNPEADEVPVGVVKQRYEQEKKTALDYLGGVKDRLTAKGVAAEVHLEEGKAADAILRYAAPAGVSLIVMSTHGRGGLGRLVLGSVADHVLRHSSVAVLLVRPATGPA